MKCLTILFVSLLSLSAFAEEGRAEFALGPQFDNRSGWLTREKNPVGGTLSYHILTNETEDGVKSFFDLQIGWMSFEGANAGAYPFAADEDINQMSLAFLPNIGFWSVGGGHFFAGVGPQILTLTQSTPDYSQTYGVMLWQLGYRKELSERWSFNVKTNYAHYDSSFNDQDSFFANWAILTQVGYRF